MGRNFLGRPYVTHFSLYVRPSTPKAKPARPPAQLARLEAQPARLEAQPARPRGENGQADEQTDGKSPHSTGLRTLSGPLPKKSEAERSDYGRTGGPT